MLVLPKYLKICGQFYNKESIIAQWKKNVGYLSKVLGNNWNRLRYLTKTLISIIGARRDGKRMVRESCESAMP